MVVGELLEDVCWGCDETGVRAATAIGVGLAIGVPALPVIDRTASLLGFGETLSGLAVVLARFRGATPLEIN